MDIRALSETHAVSPQIEPGDAPALAAAGFETVICNRPDAEVPPALRASALRAAVEAAGMRFVELPATHATIDAALVAAQRAAAEGRTLAYCASGTRSSVIWAMAEAERRAPGDVLADAARAGYDLAGLAPRLEAIHAASPERGPDQNSDQRSGSATASAASKSGISKSGIPTSQGPTSSSGPDS
jgi:uncharacterized protein (TIGR01244 family)